MGMPCKSATFPDAVSSGSSMEHVVAILLPLTFWLGRHRSRNESEDLPCENLVFTPAANGGKKSKAIPALLPFSLQAFVPYPVCVRPLANQPITDE